jgi:hypothetical protein
MRYKSILRKGDLISAATVAVVAGEAKVLGKYQVKAKEIVEPGVGLNGAQSDALGRLYMKIMDNAGTPAEVTGVLRLSVWTPQNRQVLIIDEWPTEDVSQNPTDRTKQFPFPETGVEVTEDMQLVLEFIADTSATVSKANSDIRMAVMRTEN